MHSMRSAPVWGRGLPKPGAVHGSMMREMCCACLTALRLWSSCARALYLSSSCRRLQAWGLGTGFGCGRSHGMDQGETVTVQSEQTQSSRVRALDTRATSAALAAAPAAPAQRPWLCWPLASNRVLIASSDTKFFMSFVAKTTNLQSNDQMCSGSCSPCGTNLELGCLQTVS